MIRINLLPHRAEKRRIRKIQFFALLGSSFVLALVVVGLGHWALQAKIEQQEHRNRYLQSETDILVHQIEEIKKLREQIDTLLARKTVVDNLQGTRSDVVHLLDQMLRILPEGVYLRSLKQSDAKISVVGYTQSNARVSTLMGAIEDSPWLESAELIEIHAAGSEGNRFSEFSLTFSLTHAANGKPAKKKGGA